MILHALKEYYDRKSDLPKIGFEEKEIPYIVVLNADGVPVNLSSTYEGSGKAKRAKRFIAPQSVKKTSGIASNLLWDNPEYVLGVALKGKPDRVVKQHEAFKERVDALGDIDDLGVAAVRKFLSEPDKAAKLEVFAEWEELLAEGKNVSFQLAGETSLVMESPAVKAAVAASSAEKDDQRGLCLISGESEPIEQLHAAIKGVWGAQSVGANIVSFNAKAFESFGKKQGGNAPVGKAVAFAYTTALNHLLGKDSGQRFQVGDASTVCWSAKETDFERNFVDFFGEPPKDDPDRNVRAVAALFDAPKSGAFAEDDPDCRFYALGLAPNAARLAVRFWNVGTVKDMADKIRQHFRDIEIVHGPKESGVLSIFRLLVATASRGKADNIPPNLAGDTMRAILDGQRYPQTLLLATLCRVKAEREITYPRAALIKACLNRSIRFSDQPNNERELTVSLDLENTNIGYRLGRLFATLEKIQAEAQGSINATIRDRFYGSASCSPATVFGSLMKLNKHHLSKLENPGRRIFFDNLLGEIIAGIDAEEAFPPYLSLEAQGRFAIGYYHQTRDFFTKKADKQQSQDKENQ